MKTSFTIFILATICSGIVSAANPTKPKYKCSVETQSKESVKHLDIPFDAKKNRGELTFEDSRAQKAEYSFFGDALKMKLFTKTNSEQDPWQTIAESVSSGDVRAAMLKGPPGILVTCTKSP